MKKLVPILLALAMVFALGITAFADTTTLNINGTDRTYVGYQLLTLTISHKTPDTCNGTHTDDCYNYAYSVNDKYLSVLQEEVLVNADETFWENEDDVPTSADKVTKDEILDYLEKQESDENGEFKSMREVADRLYSAIKAANNIEADVKDLTGPNATIDQGYWLFADVTDLDGENEANSLVIVDTAGQENITITPKTDLPTVEKKVKDINDSNATDETNNVWQDSADHDIKDIVDFKLTATLPSNVSNYETYKIVFHDEMSAGLTLDATTIKVYMYASKDAANADTDMNSGTDVTDKFVITTTGLTDNCTFEVSCEDVLTIGNVDKNTVFVVYYQATLNESAVIGSAGNPNEVYLEFSNNPYTDGTGETEKDKVIVFTYKLVINKTDESGNPLKGAGFTLSKKNAEGVYTVIGTELKGDDMTTFTWTGLDDGDYKLVESTVPNGYNKMADVEFTISATHDEEKDDPALTALTGTLGTGEVTTGAITETIENKSGAILPETGAKGTFLLICGGTLLALIAVVFMITRKKMSVYED